MSWREAYPNRFGPGLFAGITLGRWLRILRQNQFAWIDLSTESETYRQSSQGLDRGFLMDVGPKRAEDAAAEEESGPARNSPSGKHLTGRLLHLPLQSSFRIVPIPRLFVISELLLYPYRS